MEPTLHSARVNGVELAYWERGERRPDLPTLLFVHATGFHGRVFDRVIEAFPGYHSIALEQRGHGVLPAGVARRSSSAKPPGKKRMTTNSRPP